MKKKIQALWTIYQELGHLQFMLWISFALMAIQALWAGVILGAMGAFLQLSLTSIQGGSLTSAVPQVIAPFLQIMESIPSERRLILSFILMGGVYLLGSLMKVAIFSYQSLFSIRFIYEFRRRVFASLLHNELAFFDTHKKGELLQTVMNESKAHYTIIRSLLNSATSLFQLAVMFLVALSMSWQLCLVVFALGVVLASQNFYGSNYIRKLARYAKTHLRELLVAAEEGLGHVKQIKLLNYVDTQIKKFLFAAWESESTNRRGEILIHLQEAISMMGAFISLLLVAWLNHRYQFLQVPSLILFVYTLYRIFAPMSVINQDVGYINQYLPMAEAVSEFIDQAAKTQETGGLLRPAHLVKNGIEFRNVSLSYKTRPHVLHDFSLFVKHQECVALVGPSGAGKTSVANLLVRLYEPSSGSIFIDDVRLDQYDLEFLRNRIGLVSQDTSIFNATVRENLLLAKPEATSDEIEQACRLAYADHFISQLPKTFDTLLGDRGVQLSGGQRQRIQLAQIFLKNPEILILDEATSALDSESEKYIQKALKNLAKDRTTLIIAHRLSTIRDADRIIVLEGGRKVEEGNWTQLMSREGRFAQLVAHQAFETVPSKTGSMTHAD